MALQDKHAHYHDSLDNTSVIDTTNTADFSNEGIANSGLELEPSNEYDFVDDENTVEWLDANHDGR